MTTEQIQAKLKEVSKKTQLLQLNNHRTLGDYLIVVPVTIEETGITTRARQYEDRPDIGLVVSVGKNVVDIPEGSIIFFGKYSQDNITHDGVQYLLIRQEDVYCVAE